MQSKQVRLISLVFMAFLILMACNLPGQALLRPTPTQSINTKVAATFNAQLTELALRVTPTSPTLPTETPTHTPEELLSPSPTSTSTSSPTPIPSFTPLPTYTAYPSPTRTLQPATTPGTPIPGSGGSSSGPCNAAQFLKDITVPDGTEFPQGETFTKTWRIKNVGYCTWSTSYSLVFVGGDSMGAPTSGVPLPYTVKPGEYVDASVNLVAPSTPGDYKGNWKLSDISGNVFGIGKNYSNPFYVSIEVTTADSGIVLSFAPSFCSADWESNTAAVLPCPGDVGDDNGFVIYLTNPNLENRHENEPTLWVQPDFNTDGFISGIYPAFTVKSGDRFRADVGCLYDNPDCDLTFKLDYYNEGGILKPLAEWHEVYDVTITEIDIELSSLVDKTVRFVLTAQASTKTRDDAGFWFYPQIYRP